MSGLKGFRDHCRAREAVEHLPAPERALWKQLADEIDEYLTRPAMVVDLFGEASAEPEMSASIEEAP